MIDEDDGIVDVELCVVAANSRSAREAEINIAEAAFHGCADEIEAAPICSGSWIACDAYMLRFASFSEYLSSPVYSDGCPGSDINRGAGLNRECHSIGDGEIAADVVRTATGRPDRISGQRAGNIVYWRAGIIPNRDVCARKLDIIGVERLYQNIVYARLQGNGIGPACFPSGPNRLNAVNQHLARI